MNWCSENLHMKNKMNGNFVEKYIYVGHLNVKMNETVLILKNGINYFNVLFLG